ncbi:prepilin-type N-terminal cleavage/methylation domain-containing protein [Salinimonas chungwhensis]|uniref:prepilin-type N-terminal cleavage/methylation domain-containing protein n=1 Tax=Salinimonas chungwhensis TaxID=265425 RepID=UPI00035D109F|nr:prepilin-type N-terminal cleavage/methylation domain-containing protein [Salinimonas chungwhensis]
MRPFAQRRHQRGVGLIEILITLFILAVGLLGVASLQFVGSFANKDAISRTQSELVAKQIAERLRSASRPAQVGDGLVVDNAYFTPAHYNFANLSCAESDPYACYCLSRPAAIPDCESGQCNESQMAQYDGWALSCAAVQTNPATEISVNCTDSNGADGDDCSAGSRIHILLRWPVSTQPNQKYTLTERCNPVAGNAFACIFKDIVL